jgi:hypothetical protein
LVAEFNRNNHEALPDKVYRYAHLITGITRDGLRFGMAFAGGIVTIGAVFRIGEIGLAGVEIMEAEAVRRGVITSAKAITAGTIASMAVAAATVAVAAFLTLKTLVVAGVRGAGEPIELPVEENFSEQATKAFVRAVLQNDIDSLPEEQRAEVLSDYQSATAIGMERFVRAMIEQLIKSPHDLSNVDIPTFLQEIRSDLNTLQTRYGQLENKASFCLNYDPLEITENMSDAQILIKDGRCLAGRFVCGTGSGIDWRLITECADGMSH